MLLKVNFFSFTQTYLFLFLELTFGLNYSHNNKLLQNFDLNSFQDHYYLALIFTYFYQLCLKIINDIENICVFFKFY